jgi:hypothetical protein
MSPLPNLWRIMTGEDAANLLSGAITKLPLPFCAADAARGSSDEITISGPKKTGVGCRVGRKNLARRKIELDGNTRQPPLTECNAKANGPRCGCFSGTVTMIIEYARLRKIDYARQVEIFAPDLVGPWFRLRQCSVAPFSLSSLIIGAVSA